MEESGADRFLAAAGAAAALATAPEVAARWGDASACEGMTVGGLAHHLASQIDTAVRLLGAGPSDLPPIPLADHYAGAAWVREGLDGAANIAIREGGDAQAAGGPEVLAGLVAHWLDALPGALAVVSADDAVLVPWQGWSLTAHDFLVTRMMEIVVHSDDLAASVGLATPELPEAVLLPVLALLTTVSLHRHGQDALVRALSRPQRASGPISAF